MLTAAADAIRLALWEREASWGQLGVPRSLCKLQIHDDATNCRGLRTPREKNRGGPCPLLDSPCLGHPQNIREQLCKENQATSHYPHAPRPRPQHSGLACLSPTLPAQGHPHFRVQWATRRPSVPRTCSRGAGEQGLSSRCCGNKTTCRHHSCHTQGRRASCTHPSEPRGWHRAAPISQAGSFLPWRSGPESPGLAVLDMRPWLQVAEPLRQCQEWGLTHHMLPDASRSPKAL